MIYKDINHSLEKNNKKNEKTERNDNKLYPEHRDTIRISSIDNKDDKNKSNNKRVKKDLEFCGSRSDFNNKNIIRNYFLNRGYSLKDSNNINNKKNKLLNKFCE